MLLKWIWNWFRWLSSVIFTTWKNLFCASKHLVTRHSILRFEAWACDSGSHDSYRSLITLSYVRWCKPMYSFNDSMNATQQWILTSCLSPVTNPCSANHVSHISQYLSLYLCLSPSLAHRRNSSTLNNESHSAHPIQTFWFEFIACDRWTCDTANKDNRPKFNNVTRATNVRTFRTFHNIKVLAIESSSQRYDGTAKWKITAISDLVMTNRTIDDACSILIQNKEQ